MSRYHRPLPSRRHFVRRLSRNAVFAISIVFGAVGIGMLGYHHFERLSWIDALLNASFILSGMGPVNPIQTTVGKLFASFYALFSGVIFLTVAAVMFGPAVHRLLHRFHLELEQPPGTKDRPRQ